MWWFNCMNSIVCIFSANSPTTAHKQHWSVTMQCVLRHFKRFHLQLSTITIIHGSLIICHKQIIRDICFDGRLDFFSPGIHAIIGCSLFTHWICTWKSQICYEYPFYAWISWIICANKFTNSQINKRIFSFRCLSPFFSTLCVFGARAKPGTDINSTNTWHNFVRWMDSLYRNIQFVGMPSTNKYLPDYRGVSVTLKQSTKFPRSRNAKQK